jgi:hypothetical protein
VTDADADDADADVGWESLVSHPMMWSTAETVRARARQGGVDERSMRRRKKRWKKQ